MPTVHSSELSTSTSSLTGPPRPPGSQCDLRLLEAGDPMEVLVLLLSPCGPGQSAQSLEDATARTVIYTEAPVLGQALCLPAALPAGLILISSSAE